MLQTIESQLTRVVTRPLLSTVNTAVEEGTCLMGTYDSDGQLVVSPCGGASDEVFAGFAVAEIAAPGTLVAIERFEIAADHTTAGKKNSRFSIPTILRVGCDMFPVLLLIGEQLPLPRLVDADGEWKAEGTTLTVFGNQGCVRNHLPLHPYSGRHSASAGRRPSWTACDA